MSRKALRQHHREATARAVAKIKADPNVIAIILGGSLAHGFARPDSDVDFMIVVSDREYRRRTRTGRLTWWDQESTPYPGGYAEGKYMDLGFLKKVAARGSEPARYAFQDAKVVFTRSRAVPKLVREIARYPEAGREKRMYRFFVQFAAWQWYYYEGLRHRIPYLRHFAVSKILLFGCRLILARNRRLYPYHKWLVAEIARQKRKPRGVVPLINRLAARPNPRDVRQFFRMVMRCAKVKGTDRPWHIQFMLDSELNWIDGEPAVDDL